MRKLTKNGGLVFSRLLMPGLLLALISCSGGPKQKVFVLGLDGLTFDLLLPWVREGKLPHFSQLLEEGSSTQLISAIPPSSPPAWTSAVTGVNPGKHGIFGFVKGIDYGQKDPQLIFYTAMDRRADPIWVVLSELERRSVVVNVPCTSPPDEINGVMISGFPHTSPQHFTYPPDYRLKIPEYRLDRYGQLVPMEGEDTFLEDVNDLMDRRAETIFQLMEEEPWDLFFAVFTITDRVQHYFWKFMDSQHPTWDPAKAELYGDAILKAYQRVDRFLGRLRGKLGEETTLVVMSDHGFGPVYGIINGENFLGKTIPQGAFRVMGSDNFGAKFSLWLKKGYAPDEEETQKAYFQTRELLKGELDKLQDPVTGQKAIQQIYEREQVYWGPYVNEGPDLIALTGKGFLFWNWHYTEEGDIFPDWDDPVFGRLFNGYHLMNGVLMMAGANVRRGVNSFDAQLMDIAPSVLYLLGAPIPSQMDGRVLSAAVSGDYLETHPVESRWSRPVRVGPVGQLDDSSAVVNKHIEDQLRAIGYVQ